jgi:DeoR/GlpR family transcriptional regulator of sugar metabolism/DNA-binding LacI/PurR family transcriptional regulator
MLLSKREKQIIEIVNKHGGYGVRELALHFDVTEVTIRRDLRKLEEHRLLQRLHGGAVPVEGVEDNGTLLGGTADDLETNSEDALILAPVQNTASHTLRERTLRKQTPFLAESCPQEGAIYLGPDNFEAGYALGRWTGKFFQEKAGHESTAYVLDISEYDLPNTRERSEGFAEGIKSVLAERVVIHSIDGGGMYVEAYQIASDALKLNLKTNIIFGINDDSVLAGIQAYLDLDLPPENLIAVNVGGEGATSLKALSENTPLIASVGLFPEIVGELAIDAIVHLWSGGQINDSIITPYTLLTKDNLNQYYQETERGWELERSHAISVHNWTHQLPPGFEKKEIAFVILHQTHEWYQNVARAMQRRATEIGIHFTVKNLKDDLETEIKELRRLIGKLAASQVQDGETIILDTGSTTNYMAQFLRHRTDLTVITNSHDIFNRLHTSPGITLMLTGGQYDPKTRSFVGRGAQLMLRDMRVDKAFIVAGGVSTEFGVSSVTLQEAEVRRGMIDAAREIIVLADHTTLQEESNYRVTALENVHTLITDAGIRASQSLELSQLGIKVVVAGRVTNQD